LQYSSISGSCDLLDQLSIEECIGAEKGRNRDGTIEGENTKEPVSD
jgi:hypothetical protein